MDVARSLPGTSVYSYLSPAQLSRLHSIDERAEKLASVSTRLLLEHSELRKPRTSADQAEVDKYTKALAEYDTKFKALIKLAQTLRKARAQIDPRLPAYEPSNVKHI